MKPRYFLPLSLCLSLAACTAQEDPPGSSAGKADQVCDVACDPGHSQVDSQSGCLQDDAVCYSIYACGAEIVCTGPGSCATCDPGHTRIDSETSCLQDDAVCYSMQSCGAQILCTGPGACATCEPGDLEIDGPTSCLQDDAVCYSIQSCGAELWCTGPADR